LVHIKGCRDENKEDKIKDRVVKDNKIESKVVGEELTIQSR
jgi:hypothetical protein